MRSLLTELNKIYVKLGGSESDIPVDKKEDVTYVLRKIYFKLGGEESDISSYKVNDVEYLIDKIEDKVGGGGSSDFSTAEVTFTRATAEGDFAVYVPNLQEIDGVIYYDSDMVDSGEYSVVLYEGYALGTVVNRAGDGTRPIISVSGNVQVDGNKIFITGDGTITISYTPPI